MADRSVSVRLRLLVQQYVSGAQQAAKETDRLQRKANDFQRGHYQAQVSVDTAAARAGIDETRRALDRVDGNTVDSRVHADTGQARTQLDQVDRQLDNIDGQTATADVRVTGTAQATSRMRNLTAAIGALGPVAIPVTAAASAGMLGLGAATGVAAAGASSASLAFAGVGDALSAMQEAETSAASNATQAAQQQTAAAQQVADAKRGVAEAQRNLARVEQQGQRQIADASRAVQDAEEAQARAAAEGARSIAEAKREVAQARANAAYQAEQAAQRVEDAEEQLAQAHQRVQYAQEALHQARQQAIRDLQDLREETRDNALAVESAEIALAKARRQLAATTRDETATELELREARLRVAQAEDRLSDAQRQARRNRAELTEAEQEGISNADNVVEARRRLAEAEQGVVEAREQVAQAQQQAARTQRQSSQRIQEAIRGVEEARRQAARRNEQAAERVAEAQRNLARTEADAARSRADAARRVEQAQRGVQQAMQQMSQTMADQSSEAQKLQEEMQALSPAGRDFVRFLHNEMRPRVQDLQATAQAGLLPGVEDGLRSLIDIWPQLNRVVDNSSTALGDMAANAGEALTSPFWRDFISWVGTEAGPKLRSFGRIAGNVGTGFAGMAMESDALADDLIANLERMSQRFERWGTTLSSNEGFQDFVAYARENGPEVVDTLEQVADTVGAIVEAGAPIGPVLLDGLETFAALVERIAETPGLGTGLIALGGGMVAVNKAIGAYNAVKASALVTTASNMGAAGRRGNRGIRALAGGMGRLGVAVGGVYLVNEALNTLGDRLDGLPDVGQQNLVAGLTAIGTEGRVASGTLDTLNTDLGQYRQAIEELQQPGWRQPLAWLNQINPAVTGKVEQAEQSLRDLDSALTTMVEKGNGQAAARVVNQLGLSAQQATEYLPGYTQALARADVQAGNAASSGSKLQGATDRVKGSAREASPQVQILADKYGRSQAEAKSAWRAVSDLDSELSTFFDISFGVQEAQDKVTRNFLQMQKQVENTDASLEGQNRASLTLRSTMRGQVRDIGSLMTEEALHAGSLKEVKQNTQDNIDRFRRYARRMGLNEEAVKQYTDKLKDARIDVINEFKTKGLGKVKDDVVELHDKFVDLGGTYAARLEGGGLGPKFRATGGAIQGPGGPREDRIPVMASNNEHMWTASEVAGAGGHQTVEALRKLAASGRLPGLANGGPVTTTTMVNASPLASDLSQSPLMNMDVGGFGGNVSQWADEAATALRMLGQPLSLVNNVLKLIRTESGGDPNAINLTDINARMGMPSQGLIQVIPPTFAAYRHGSLGGITDPLANLYAGLNYGLNRYGSLTDSDIYVGGYDQGNMLPPGLSLAYNGTGSSEHKAVFTQPQWQALQRIASAAEQPRPRPMVASGGDGAAAPSVRNYNANFYGPVQQPRDSRDAVMSAFHDFDTLYM